MQALFLDNFYFFYQLNQFFIVFCLPEHRNNVFHGFLRLIATKCLTDQEIGLQLLLIQKQIIPADSERQKILLRGLMNVRPAKQISPEFLSVQDEYLRQELSEAGVTHVEDLQPVSGDLYLWQGDITKLSCGAIVNAANSGLTGCYVPNHACIDNCIHTYAGVQLRLDCAEIMEKQGHEEPTGQAKLTRAYNLPCSFVLHTVGPIVTGEPTKEDEQLLASCYRSCLSLAEENGVKSIAFCCISTGVFHFPNERAAEIAIDTVRQYKSETGSEMKVIFNVFKDLDKEIYERLLQRA